MAESRASHFRCLFNRAHISGVLRYKRSRAIGLVAVADELERKARQRVTDTMMRKGQGRPCQAVACLLRERRGSGSPSTFVVAA